MKLENNKAKITGIIGEIAVLMSIVLAYTVSAIMFKREDIPYGFVKYLIGGGALVSLAIILLYLFRKRKSLSNIIKGVKEHKIIIAVIIIAILLRLGMMNELPRWDSGEYSARLMSAAYEFKFSFSQIIDSFTLCNHPTIAFAMLYSIGEFMFPGQVVGVMLVNLVVTVAGLACVYNIILKLFGRVTKTQAALYTMVISVLPLFYGTFGYLNPDYPLALFIIFAICAYLYKRNILLFAACCFAVQTKETGIVLIAGLFGGICLEVLIKNAKYGFVGFIKKIFTNISIYMVGMAALIQLYYMKRIGGVSNWAQTGTGASSMFKWDNNGDNCFGFNPEYVLARFKQFFVINFNWILTIIVIAAVIIVVYRAAKKKKYSIIHTVSAELITLLSVFGVYILFSSLYITAALDRYNVVSVLLWAMIALYAVHIIFGNNEKKNVIIRNSVLAVLTVLMFVQSFITIDPVSKAVFVNKNTGDNAVNMIYCGINSNKSLMPMDYLVYNNQFRELDKGLEALMREADYNESMDVVSFIETYPLKVSGNTGVYSIHWDRDKKKRVFYMGESVFPIVTIEEKSLRKGTVKYDDLAKEALTFFVPYYKISEDTGLSFLSRWYNIGERFEYNSIRGNMVCYRLSLKDRAEYYSKYSE